MVECITVSVHVVICSHFSIFGTLETTDYQQQSNIHIVT